MNSPDPSFFATVRRQGDAVVSIACLVLGIGMLTWAFAPIVQAQWDNRASVQAQRGASCATTPCPTPTRLIAALSQSTDSAQLAGAASVQASPYPTLAGIGGTLAATPTPGATPAPTPVLPTGWAEVGQRIDAQAALLKVCGQIAEEQVFPLQRSMLTIDADIRDVETAMVAKMAGYSTEDATFVAQAAKERSTLMTAWDTAKTKVETVKQKYQSCQF